MNTTNFGVKPKVAFVCVHNSCCSQIAEALGKLLAADAFESFSAGTELKTQINQDAVRIMKTLYGVDMEKTQYPKLLSDIPAVDIVVTMGCNVQCPLFWRTKIAVYNTTTDKLTVAPLCVQIRPHLY